MADYPRITDADRTWRDGGTTTEKVLIVAVQGAILVDVRSVIPTFDDSGVPLVAGTQRDAIELPSGARWWYRSTGGAAVVNRIGLGA